MESKLADLRRQRRTLLTERQTEFLRQATREPEAIRRVVRDTVSQMRDLRKQIDKIRHDRARSWKSMHQGMHQKLAQLAEGKRNRRFEPWYPGQRPRPEPDDFFDRPPDDFFDRPPDDIPEFGPSEALCSVTTLRIEQSANHGFTVDASPVASPGIATSAQFDPTRGVNEVKMSVGIESDSEASDLFVAADAAWRFDFNPPSTGTYTVRPLAFLSGAWVLSADAPGTQSTSANLNVRLGLRVTQFDGPTLYETVEQSVLQVAAEDEDQEGEIYFDSVSAGPMELTVPLAKDLRTHLIVRCAVSVRLVGVGLGGLDLAQANYYFRVPEVQVDFLDCPLPSSRPRLLITPTVVALRKNDQLAVAIAAEPPFDGNVTITTSDSAAISVITPASLTNGHGSATVTAREQNRVVEIGARRSGYLDARATAYVENSSGSWEEGPPIDGFVAVHAVLLHTGKVLMFSASHETHDEITDIDKGKSFLWNPADDSPAAVPISRNLFCSGHCQLGDGRVLVAGGQNLFQVSFRAIPGIFNAAGADRDIHTFDPVAEAWTRHDDMPEKRWYPACVTLPNGRGMIVGGTSYGSEVWFQTFNKTREIFQPADNSLTAPVFFRNGLLYPFVQLLPGAFLFVHRRNRANLFDLAADDWVRDPTNGFRLSFPTAHDGTRTYPGEGSCVPLTIDALDHDRVNLLVIGGSADLEPLKDSDTTETVEFFEFHRDDPASSRWRPAAPLPDKRFMCDATLLADGSVFVTNGAAKGRADDNSGCRLASYIFEPWNNVWLPMADSLRLRAYHSIALLLPDARVVVGGSTGHEFLDREDEFRLDVFTPPYLTRGPRPAIAGAPQEVTLGEEFQIRVSGGSARRISDVALVRPGATTHSNNMDQRRIRLPILERAGNVIRSQAPSSSAVAPVGFYMLFVLNQFGVPSVATFVRLKES
jgi:hypothetical protein